MATIIFLLAKCFPGQVFGPRPKARVSLDSRSILNSSGLLNTEGSRLAAAIPNKIREFGGTLKSKKLNDLPALILGNRATDDYHRDNSSTALGIKWGSALSRCQRGG